MRYEIVQMTDEDMQKDSAYFIKAGALSTECWDEVDNAIAWAEADTDTLFRQRLYLAAYTLQSGYVIRIQA